MTTAPSIVPDSVVVEEHNAENTITTPKKNPFLLLNYKEYETSSSVSADAMRVRRHPQLTAETVGNIPKGGKVKIVCVIDGWGKLHSLMESELRDSGSYIPHDLATEGWTLMATNGVPNYVLTSNSSESTVPSTSPGEKEITDSANESFANARTMTEVRKLIR